MIERRRKAEILFPLYLSPERISTPQLPTERFAVKLSRAAQVAECHSNPTVPSGPALAKYKQSLDTHIQLTKSRGRIKSTSRSEGQIGSRASA
jgi:hypothetical protein